MQKHEIAAYLASLNTLLDGQDDAATARSQTLSAEYEKYWLLLKDSIARDNRAATAPAKPHASDR